MDEILHEHRLKLIGRIAQDEEQHELRATVTVANDCSKTVEGFRATQLKAYSNTAQGLQ